MTSRTVKKEYTLQNLQTNKKLVVDVFPTSTKYKNKIGEAFNLYIEALIRNNKSVNTIKIYYTHVNELLDFIQKNYPKVNTPAKIKVKHVNEFYDYCQSFKGNSSGTIRHKKVAIEQFFNYLVEQNIIQANKKPIEEASVIKNNVKSVQKAPTFLESFEINDFFEVIENTESNDKIKPLRDYCLFALLITSGVRISEALSFNVQDILELKSKGTLRIIGKGNKERVIAVPEEAFSSGFLSKFDDYLKVRAQYESRITAKKDKNALFISREGTRLTSGTVQRSIKKYIEKTGIYKDITPHKLRHTFATILAKNNTNLKVIQELLGHDCIQTTQRYLHTLTNDLKDGVQNLKF